MSFYLNQLQKVLKKYFLHVFSSVPCFVLKVVKFEFQSFSQCVTCWRLSKNMPVTKKHRFPSCFCGPNSQYTRRRVYTKCLLVQYTVESAKDSQTKFQMFLKVSSHQRWCTSAVHQHGASILNSTNLSNIFCRITQVRNIAQPRDLDPLVFIPLL